MKIEDQNKLIAEFIDFPYNDPEQFIVTDYNVAFTCERVGTLDDLKYHSSWDWLMPVVEKIAKIEYEHQIGEDGKRESDRAYLLTFAMINDETGDFMIRFNRCSLYQASTLIEATWLAVIDYIKET